MPACGCGSSAPRVSAHAAAPAGPRLLPDPALQAALGPRQRDGQPPAPDRRHPNADAPADPRLRHHRGGRARVRRAASPCSPAKPARASPSWSMRCCWPSAAAPTADVVRARRRARRGRRNLRHSAQRRGAARGSRNSRSSTKTNASCGASSAATAAPAATSTARRCRCSRCARSASCWSTSTASTNSSRCRAAARSASARRLRPARSARRRGARSARASGRRSTRDAPTSNERARDRESRLDLLRYQVSELEALDLEAGRSGSARRRTQAHRQPRPAGRRHAHSVAALLDGDDGGATRRSGARAGACCDSSSASMPRSSRHARAARRGHDRGARSGMRAAPLSRKRSTSTRRGRNGSSAPGGARGPARKHRVEPRELPACATRSRPSSPSSKPAPTAMPTLRRSDSRRRASATSRCRASSRPRATAARGARWTARSPRCMQALGMAGGVFAIARRAAGPPALRAWQRRGRVPGQRQPGPAAAAAGQGRLGRRTVAHQPRAAGGRASRPHICRCMVFDEVDAGVGGAVAEIVGRQLHALGGDGPGAVRDAPATGRSQADHQLRVSKLTAGRHDAHSDRRPGRGGAHRGTRAHAGRHESPTARASTRAKCWQSARQARRRAKAAISAEGGRAQGRFGR